MTMAWFRKKPPEPPVGKPYPTRDGVWVRSPGEQKIANFLSRRALGYEYEPKVLRYRPDFALTDHPIVIEYWGGAGFHRYEGQMAEKSRAYEAAGLRLISIVPLQLAELERVLDKRLREHGVV